MLGCVAQVLPLVRYGAVYVKVYLKDLSGEFDESAVNLREVLVNLYAKVLEVLARAKNELNGSGGTRFLNALLHPGEGEELVQALDEAGKQLGLAVQACEAVQSKKQNAEARELLQSLDKPERGTLVNCVCVK